MDSHALIDALRRKFGAPNNNVLAKRLGVSSATIHNWHTNSHELTPKRVAELIKKTKQFGAQEATKHAIRPIVEYYPISAAESKQGASWEPLDTANSGNKREQKLKDWLKSEVGIYIFYDSRGAPLYVGKAKRQSLWDEMKSAFNRDRRTQKIRMVSHPSTGTGFRPAFEAPRKIAWSQLQLVDLSSYFSAFATDKDLIDDLEALLARSFANSLLNSRMETFTIRD